MSPEEFHGASIGHLPSAILGITRMLTESSHQFDILDSSSDLSPYRVVVLPDHIPVSAGFAHKLEAYLARGGALIASFASGMDPSRQEFALKALGVTLQSEGPRDLQGELVRGRLFPSHDYVDYLLPTGPIGQGLPPTEHVMYLRGMDVQIQPGAEVLASTILPYFDRTYHHFCSHRQTPSSGQVGSAAVVKNGPTIYFAHPIFTQYDQIAARWSKTLFLNALAQFLPEPLLRHDGPSTLQVTVNEQAQANRWVVHLLHYIPERRSQSIDVIEDVIPLYQVRVSVKTPRPIQVVKRVPEQEILPHEQQGSRVEFVLPKLVGHQMVALEF